MIEKYSIRNLRYIKLKCTAILLTLLLRYAKQPKLACKNHMNMSLIIV